MQQSLDCLRTKKTFEVMHDIYDLVDLPIAYVPFCVQNLVLLALQRYLEAEAFRFVQQWLPKEAEANEWSCAEALELHKLFPFLKRHFRKLPMSAFPQKQKPPPNWHEPICAIRHAAVHRISQNRTSLLQMVNNAIGLVWSLSGNCEAKKLYEFWILLDYILPQTHRAQIDRSPAPVLQTKGSRRAQNRKTLQAQILQQATLRRALGGVFQAIEDKFVLEFRQTLKEIFPASRNQGAVSIS
ncbi:hypothetical protein N7478_010649 [Penicillium angulare]|uniref:uncharacterized protein n=1 Tax=Penicillium angulare TaxID=116970 RepID=UPI0025409D1E|nr:uncharacterized protein N7478_010649 [Penicillium angulare]KAJ5267841.1 hypothetical protein N7478_010649 [Penicillium angulare]